MKVAGFSVGGVMVSTTGSDPVDRGSTPFLPTTFKLFICYLEKLNILFWHPSVRIDVFSRPQRGVGGCIVLS